MTPTAIKTGYGYTGTGALIENDIYYFHSDHLGSTSYLTNKHGIVSQHVEYIPFGETLIESHLNNQNNPYLYNGKELDMETGFYYYGARYYEPKSSLWLSVDPLAEKYRDWSPYAYTFNNPINFVDPTGMAGEDWYEPIDKNGNGTGKYEWFDGNLEIEGYKHIAYDFKETNFDVNGKSTTIDYRGKDKSSYLYNKNNGKFDILLKNYDNTSKGKDVLTNKFINSPIAFGKQVSGALVNGFQGIGAMMYETASGNFNPDDGGDIIDLGYKPLMNIESTLMYNNGKWIHVNLHSRGDEVFFKKYMKSMYDTYSIYKLPTNIEKSWEWIKKIF